MAALPVNRFGTGKQLLLLALTLGLWAFIIYIRLLAPPDVLLFIGAIELDTVAHLAGGVFLGLLAEWRMPRLRLWQFIPLVLLPAAAWEVLEYVFDAETRFFYATAFDLWRLDSAGDIVAAFLGGYGYWVFGRNRRR